MAKAKKDLTLLVLQFRLKGMMAVLILQYVAGMIINTFGSDDPSQRTPLAVAAFFTHAILALLLLAGAIVIWFTVRKTDEQRLIRNARHGIITIIVAILAGIATPMFKDTASEIFSLIMALSFLGAFYSYGLLFFLVNKSPLPAKT